MKSIVLLGATGMIGQRILIEALSRGHQASPEFRLSRGRYFQAGNGRGSSGGS
jgi:hypothetical protein